jgi:hypothetical protein
MIPAKFDFIMHAGVLPDFDIDDFKQTFASDCRKEHNMQS